MFSTFTGLFGVSPSAPSPAQKKREAIKEFLGHGQNGLLIGSAALWLFYGTTSFTLSTAVLGFYLEILAKNFYEKVKQDPVTAQYIAANFSTISKYATTFNLFVLPTAKGVIDKTISPLIVKLDQLVTVPMDGPKK